MFPWRPLWRRAAVHIRTRSLETKAPTCANDGFAQERPVLSKIEGSRDPELSGRFPGIPAGAARRGVLMRPRHPAYRSFRISPVVKRARRTTRPPKGQRPKSAAHDPIELVTVLDLVRYAVTRFAEAQLVFAHGTTDPVAEAAFIVGEALHLPLDQLEWFAPARITAQERARILSLIEARVATRRPAAYLMGRVYAAGVAFHVDERVIVPRSYLGELLAGDTFAGGEDGLAWKEPGEVGRVLDLCTGSGALAVLAAMRFPDAAVDAVDISADALEVAARNVREHGLAERIILKRGDLFAPLARERYDLIISNPPYVDAEGMATLPPECRYEPALALDGGPDGIDVIARIIEEAGRHLTDDGGLLCEVGRDRAVLEARYPRLPFLWLDTEESSGEVFWLTVDALR
jgi:ribosomal protein L3 glutamine methyltransferase